MISGPSLIPATPSKAFILCHGYGADGADLISLADMLHLSPHTALFCPNAPDILPFGGYEWFSLSDYDPAMTVTTDYLDTLFQRALPASQRVTEFITHIQHTYHLTGADIVLGGFSQGGLVSVLSALTLPDKPAGWIGMSAVPLHLSGTFNMTHIRHHIPMLLTHGTADDIVPLPAMSLNQTDLTAAGQTVETVISKGLGHGIDTTCLTAVSAFLKRLGF